MTSSRPHQAQNRNAHGGSRHQRHQLSGRQVTSQCPLHRDKVSADLLTMAEVLAELQIARSTFDTWRTLGTAPECIKLPNGQIRVRRCALDTWLTSHSDKEST